jgi:hypothetical protein
MSVLPLALVGLSLALPAGPPTAPARPSPTAGEWADLAGLPRLAVEGEGPQAAALSTTPDLETAEYAVEGASRSSQTFLLPPGPRTVRLLEAEPAAGTAEAWRLARLRLCWERDDPSDEPADVDLPFALAFGRVSANSGIGATRLVGERGGSWVNRFPMPYRARALLQIDTERPLEGRVRVRTTRGADPAAGYFRASGRAIGPGSAPARPGLSATGRGHLAGVLVVSERGPLSGAPDTPGRLVLDGRDLGPLATAVDLPWPETGTETSPLRGAVGGGPDAPSAVFRWRVADPLPFRRSLAVEGRAGLDRVSKAAGGPAADRFGRAPAVARVAVFWYSDRPAGRSGSARGPAPDPSDR